MLSVFLSSIVISLLSADKAPTKSEATAPARTASQSAPKKKVIRLEAITVEGRIQKPQAFYILRRSNLSFEDLSRSESFVPKISKSVEKEPF